MCSFKASGIRAAFTSFAGEAQVECFLHVVVSPALADDISLQHLPTGELALAWYAALHGSPCNWDTSCSASNAFRAPTLNELYRSFRVGNVLTMANATLKPEKLTGYEAGLRVRAGKHGMLQSSWFWNRINGPVANLTQSITPELITRQRQNLGQTRSRGIDTRFELTVNRSLSMNAGYLYAKATVTDFPGTPSLVGLWIPQVPRHTATAQVRLSRMKLGTLALQARYQGQQFDDDQNRFPLAGYFTLDLFAAHTLRPGVEVYVGAENMFDRRYEVGRTPVLTIGPPAMAKVGIRWTLGDTAH